MNRRLHFILLGFFLSLNVALLSQSLKGARYNTYPTGLWELTKADSSKTEKHEKRIKEEFPEFTDFILIKNDILLVNWDYNGKVWGMGIYDSEKEQYFRISNEGDLVKEQPINYQDSLIFVKEQSVNDSVKSYSYKQVNALPLEVWTHKSLPYLNISQKSFINYHSEIGFIYEFKILPLKFCFGSDRNLVVFDVYYLFLAITHMA